MAILSATQKELWKDALHACDSPWIIFGLSAEGLPAARLGGMAGLIDWQLHGQVSALILKGELKAGDFCVIPSHGPTFLLYHYSAPADLKLVLSRVKALRLSAAALAESTFPKDFSSKLKQTLEKEGISCKKLEPES